MTTGIPMDDFICMVEGCLNRADHILPDEDDKPFSICNEHLAEIGKPLSERKRKMSYEN